MRIGLVVSLAVISIGLAVAAKPPPSTKPPTLAPSSMLPPRFSTRLVDVVIDSSDAKAPIVRQALVVREEVGGALTLQILVDSMKDCALRGASNSFAPTPEECAQGSMQRAGVKAGTTTGRWIGN